MFATPIAGRALVGLLLCVCLVTCAAAVAAQDAPENPPERWNYLPNGDIGAVDFKAAHPSWDGRGVVVAILDTGVDGFAPGLLQTSTGQTKLIDVRDFSGEGDWEVTLAEREEGGDDAAAPVFLTEDGLRLSGAGQLVVPPAGGDGIKGENLAFPVYIGVIEEKQFQNNDSIYDLNDDGDTSDRFAFLVYLADRAAVEGALGIGEGYTFLQELNETAAQSVAVARQSTKVWLVVVDTDGNGNLADEQILRDYHVNHDSFALGNPDAPDARTLLAWQVNVRSNESQLGVPEAPTVELHSDGGAHGSHCAGIAAGFQVSGQDGLDGVAPGAWLISCKLGDNRLAGGATRTESMKKAYEYAQAFGERFGLPVVVNMSFGIGSVEEGDDTMGEWLDDFLAEHPDFYVCTSAGNAGPGLSTVGLPATSYSVISSGASLSVATGSDLYNAKLQRDTLFAFSSRGGETNKPDIVAPGSALSTVPGFVDGSARFNGTSMASPQTAGVVACLLSAALAEDLPVHWGIIKRALIAGGKPIDGLGMNDQGGGLVALESSWKVLRDLAQSESAHEVLWYRIETACPFQADGTSEAAYWRTPGGVPTDPERVEFTVYPVFHPDLTADERDNFFRSFSFKSDAGWLRVVSGDRYIRGDMGMQVSLQYTGDELAEPGLHAARVVGSLDGGDLSGLAGREFYLWNTVVVGEALEASNGFSRSWTGKDLPASWVRRYYVDVPAGASAMRVRLEVSSDVGSKRGSRVLTEICDPEGRVRGGFVGYASIDGDQIRDQTVMPPELFPGTWEINVVSSILAMDPSAYRLTVSCDGYDAPAVITEVGRGATGEAAEASFTVTRTYPGYFRGEVDAAIEGHSTERSVEISDADEWSHEFTLDGTTPRAEFDLVMDEATANLFTDCAVNILDSGGQAVRATGFDGTELTIGVSLPSGQSEATYKLQVVGAFALAADSEEWGFDLTEKYYFAAPTRGQVERAGGGPLRLYCGVPVELALSFDGAWPGSPSGLQPFGAVRFRDTHLEDRRPGDDTGRVVLEVPIRME